MFLLVVLELLCFAPAWTGQVRPVRNKTLHSFARLGCGDVEKKIKNQIANIKIALQKSKGVKQFCLPPPVIYVPKALLFMCL